MRLWTILALALPAGASSSVRLNEVLYDPEGADTGLEFVELGSPPEGDSTASLNGWVLETGNGARPGEWSVAWRGGPGDRLRGGLFLIAEAAVEGADVMVELDLQNGPDACRVRGPAGESDRLGWGDELDASFYEGNPAEDVSGLSLARLPDGVDTDRNDLDFHATLPTPGAFNAPEHGLAVESFVPPPPDWPPGGSWRFEWVVRNVGRRPGPARIRLLCDVHPGEVLADQTVPPGGGVLQPGERRLLAVELAPPPGVHRPRSDPGAPGEPAPWRGTGPDLLVSEALSRPRPGESEWVELESVAAGPLDLAAFRLADASGTAAGLSGILAPGRFAIVAADSAATAWRWALPPGTLLKEGSPWPSLNHTAAPGAAAERVVVTIDGIEIAVASLPGGASAGVSWEAVSRFLDPEDPGRWAACADPAGGTPGRANSLQGDRTLPPALATLSAHPSPFRPSRDRTALVVLRPRRPAASCRITVYDSSGRAVAELAPWRVHAGEHRAVWDGRNESGAPAPLGLYVLRAEAPGAAVAKASLVLVR